MKVKGKAGRVSGAIHLPASHFSKHLLLCGVLVQPNLQKDLFHVVHATSIAYFSIATAWDCKDET